jgi:flagellar L-ring protein precursor FlgH
MQRFYLIMSALALLATAGCESRFGRPTTAAAPTPVKVTVPPPSVTDGSIWQAEARADNSMVSDVKARSRGDIVTILVVEKVDAKRARNTSTSRAESGDGSVDQIVYPNVGTLNGQKPKISFSSKRSFAGGGSVTDSGTVSATVAAQVVDVMPNGNLILSGAKEVTVSGEVQVVTLTGIARPQDITTDNTVLSTNLAEARVHITGSGPLNDAQRRTMVGRLLDWVNLF